MLMEALPSLPEVQQYPAQRWEDGNVSTMHETIAEEVPVALVYNDISHVVMLSTPQNLEEFAIGFSLSEGIVVSAKEIYEIDVVPRANGIEVQLVIASERLVALKERRRNLAGRTGCGLCGTESLEHAVRPLPNVPEGQRIAAGAIHQAFAGLGGHQQIHLLTGAVHAAGWASPSGQIQVVREDVGRHNALDKLIGALAVKGIPFDAGFAVLTSRASSEMVQKAATVGISLVAAISAPTGLAIRLAEECGLTLIGFARNRCHTTYANTHRIRIESDAS
jgi:FdhD protein